ncbi:hypothetical protein CYD30_20870 [Kosakonia cowanii]|nr:hypothetical protein CYD30_20870 [Kosakonia cowanii]
MSNISYEAAAFLQQAFSPEQVEAIVNFQKSLNAQLATSVELQQVKAELKADLKTELTQFEVRLSQRLNTTIFAAVGVIATLITVLKLFG